MGENVRHHKRSHHTTLCAKSYNGQGKEQMFAGITNAARCKDLKAGCASSGATERSFPSGGDTCDSPEATLNIHKSRAPPFTMYGVEPQRWFTGSINQEFSGNGRRFCSRSRTTRMWRPVWRPHTNQQANSITCSTPRLQMHTDEQVPCSNVTKK